MATTPLPPLAAAQLEFSARGEDTALTIGVMDGVHKGHQHLIGRLVQEAAVRGLSPGVVTLHPHPITVLRPEIQASYLTSLEERLKLIREAGAAWLLPLVFSSDVAELTAEELATAMHDKLRMRLLLLGPDSRFGRGAPPDTVERMRTLGASLGFEVVQIEPLLGPNGERYSSTAVRAALADGDMERVRTVLGRSYTLTGPVVHGFERGRTIGFPTANLSIAADRALPAIGVYATHVTIGNQEYLGATNIGRRPTFDEGHISIETHILDFEGDLYGQRITLAFEQWIRPEVKFSGPEALVAQIAADVARTREILA